MLLERFERLMTCLALILASVGASSAFQLSPHATVRTHQLIVVDTPYKLMMGLPALDHDVHVNMTQVHGHDPSDCCSCMQNASSILEFHIRYYLKEKCRRKHSDRQCDKWYNSSRLLSGYILSAYHTDIAAYSYCYGKGKCKSPHAAPSWAHQAQAHPRFPGSLGHAAGRLVAKLQTPSPLHETVTKQLQQLSHGRCHACYVAIYLHIIGEVSRTVHQTCKSTTCPHVKKVCDWIKHHPHEFVGIIIGKTTPWRYAGGYCYGTRLCPHPSDPGTQLTADKTEITNLMQTL